MHTVHGLELCHNVLYHLQGSQGDKLLQIKIATRGHGMMYKIDRYMLSWVKLNNLKYTLTPHKRSALLIVLISVDFSLNSKMCGRLLKGGYKYLQEYSATRYNTFQ